MIRLKQGFTLIEIMVVITIISIVMGVALLAFPDTDSDRLKEQSMRFSALVTLAQDESILQSRDFGLSINNKGYSFYRFVEKKWQPYSEGPFKTRALDDDMKAVVILEGVDIKLQKAEKIKKPQIIISSSGEMTSFVYTINNQEKSTVTVSFDGAGNQKQAFKLYEK